DIRYSLQDSSCKGFDILMSSICAHVWLDMQCASLPLVLAWLALIVWLGLRSLDCPPLVNKIYISFTQCRITGKTIPLIPIPIKKFSLYSSILNFQSCTLSLTSCSMYCSFDLFIS